MVIRGWVYVIVNRAMPNLVKIGYSTKDPPPVPESSLELVFHTHSKSHMTRYLKTLGI